jgi:hypothetical protein
MMASPLLIGIAAGAVSAVLFASLSAGNILAILLFFLAPLPLLVAGFGWGVASAQLALVAGAVLVPLLTKLSFQSAILFSVSVGLPCMVVSWLASLRRPLSAEEQTSAAPPAVEWYPLGRIIVWTAVMAGMLVAAGILMIGDAARYHEAIKGLFNPYNMLALKAMMGASKDHAQLERVIEIFARFILPASLGFTWLLIMLTNIWLAAKSANISAQLWRPWPNLADLEYPPLTLVAFLVSIGLGMIPNQIGIVAMAFVGAFSLVYLTMGLTVVHFAVPDTAFKPIILAGMYMGLLVAGWIFMPVLILLGIGEPVFKIRRRVLGRSTPPDDMAGPNS